MKNILKFALVFALAAGFGACSKNVKDAPGADADGKGVVTEVTVGEAVILQDEDGAYGVGVVSGPTVSLSPVYFALDKYTLSNEAKTILAANAEVLKVKAIKAVVIEGNGDERGTISYNIALADKRAQEVKNYYVARGVPAKNIQVVSYGKEKPVCHASNESCWAQNRRADTIVK